MPDAPAHQITVPLPITVLFLRGPDHTRNAAGDTRFFCNYQLIVHISSSCISIRLNLDFSRFLVCIFVLAKIVLVQIIVPGGVSFGLVELEIIEGCTAAQPEPAPTEHQRLPMLDFGFLRRFGVTPASGAVAGGRLFLQTQGAVFIDVPGFTFRGAGAELGFLRFFLQQGQQVGIVHLVQEVTGRFLVLVSPVNQNVKIIPGLGGHGDKLLVAVKSSTSVALPLGVMGTPSGFCRP